MTEIFDALANGHVIGKGQQGVFTDHPVFDGVRLKTLTEDDRYRIQLVSIAPEKSIGRHIHSDETELHIVLHGNGQCVTEGDSRCYEEGTVSVIDIGTAHSVTAGGEGLYMIAIFVRSQP